MSKYILPIHFHFFYRPLNPNVVNENLQPLEHKTSNGGWMDGCSLRFMCVNPLYELFAGLLSFHEATRGTLWAE